MLEYIKFALNNFSTSTNLFNCIHVFTIILCIVVGILLHTNKENKINYTVFIICGFVLVLLSKIYLAFLGYEINYDESIHLSQAKAIAENGLVYWKDLASGSSGPINTYFILLFYYLGMPINYETIHFICALLTAINWVLYTQTLKNIKTPPTGLFLSSFIALLYFVNLKEWDFMNYHTELLPISILVLTIYLFSVYNLTNKIYLLVIIGFLFFWAFLGKIQTIPFIGFFGICYLYFAKHHSIFKKIIAFSVGALSGTLLLLGLALKFDFLQKMYFYYIERNIDYSYSSAIQNLWNYTFASPQNFENAFVISNYSIVIISGFFIWFMQYKSKSFKKIELSLLALLWIVTIYTIFKTGRQYGHYFYFLIFPLFTQIAWVGNFTFALKKSVTKNILFLIPSILIITQLAYTYDAIANNKPIYIDGHILGSEKERSLKNTALSNNIRQIVQKKAITTPKMLVWGWGGSIHILSGIPQSTPDNHIDYLQYSSPQSYSKTFSYFLADLNKTRPDIIVIMNHDFQIAEVTEIIQKEYKYEFSMNNTDVYSRRNNK